MMGARRADIQLSAQQGDVAAPKTPTSATAEGRQELGVGSFGLTSHILKSQSNLSVVHAGLKRSPSDMSTATGSASGGSSASFLAVDYSPAVGTRPLRPRSTSSGGEEEELAATRGSGSDRLESPQHIAASASRQRKKVKPFRPGDLVEIYSFQHCQWMVDGEVVEAVSDTFIGSDMEVVAGSIKVVFQSASHFQWVAPQQMEECIRLSPRQQPVKPSAAIAMEQEEQTPGFSVEQAEIQVCFMQPPEAQLEPRSPAEQPEVSSRQRVSFREPEEEQREPKSPAVQPEVSMRQTVRSSRSSRQRKKVKPFRQGDMVEVYSFEHGEWMDDGEVISAVTETIVEGKVEVVAGSVKVAFQNATHFQWVAPQQMEECLRPSQRPKPPKAFTGLLDKETHSWLLSFWHKRYVEVNRGCMLWWECEEKALSGAPAKESICLLGLKLERGNAADFTVRAEAKSEVVYGFSAESEAAMAEWMDNLWIHAAYCEEMREWSRVAKGVEECGKVSEQMLRAIGVSVPRKSVQLVRRTCATAPA